MHRTEFAVLVVEDEPLILMDATDFLEDAGFTVHSAKNADEALRLLEAHDEIRVLFTDIDTPGAMNGLALAHAVRGRWRPVHVIVTSGHWQVTTSDLPARGVFIPKPYRHDAVVDQIQRMAA